MATNSTQSWTRGLGARAVERTVDQSQLAFFKPPAVLHAEAWRIQRPSLVQAGSGTLSPVDHPQGLLVAPSAIGAILDDPVQDQWLLGPLTHPDIPPASDVKGPPSLNSDALGGLRLRQRASIVELDLATPPARSPQARGGWRGPVKDPLGTDAAQAVDILGCDRAPGGALV